MEHLTSIRRQTARFFVAYLWVHCPLVVATGWLVGAPVLLPTILALVLATAATAAHLLIKAEAARVVMAAALMLMIAVLVEVLTGVAWQIDMHMYFFAALA